MSHPDDSAMRESSVSSSSHAAPVAREGLGAETVINPERRGVADSGLLVNRNQENSANSVIWSQLFPSDNELAAGAPLLGTEGLQLGQFAIRERIGLGGMGAVFSAVDKELDRIVALKILSPAQSHDIASVKRFQNEARSAARLDHENVAKVYAVGEEYGLHYIAFEFVAGLNVREILNQRGKLAPAESLNFVLQIAGALLHTSAAGVVHRDIKPSNIIIKPNGRAKLVDWGLARATSVSQEASQELTVAGTTLGTFDYISPEQAKDPRTVDARSDIYSLGCTFYHMLTGEPPYGEGTVLQKLLDHQGKKVPDPREKNPAVPLGMSTVVMKMMMPEPEKRHQSVESLLKDLMILASRLGLRGIPAESVVWEKLNPASRRMSFWKQNAGLIGTAVLLAVLVLSIELFQGRLGSNQQKQSVAENENNLPLNTFPGNEPSPQSNSTIFPGQVKKTPWSLSENNPELTRSNSGTALPFDPYQSLASPSSFPPRIVPPYAYPSIYDSIKSGIGYEPPLDQKEKNVLPLDHPESSSPLSVEGSAMKNKTEPGSLTKLDDTNNPAEKTGVETVTTVPLKTLPYSVIRPDGKIGESYETLEGAVASALDGSVIELRFNASVTEPRIEKPIDVNRKMITIRAAKGFVPVIKFVREKYDAPGMIRVTSGGITLKDIQFIVEAERKGSTSQWTFFHLVEPREIRMQGIELTVSNKSQLAASIIEVVANPNEAFDEMKTMPTLPMKKKTPSIEIENCILKGGVDFIDYMQTASMKLSVQKSVLAIDGRVFVNQGDDSLRENVGSIEISFEYTTCYSNGNLIHVDRGELPRDAPSIQFTARNCIFGTTSIEKNPLILIEGNIPSSDLEEVFQWTGEKNFFEGYRQFLVMKGTPDILPTFSALHFEKWKLRWGRSIESAPQLNAVLWKSQNRLQPYAQWGREQFLLDATVEENPALSLGAGANPDLLPWSAISTAPQLKKIPLSGSSGVIIPPVLN